MKKNNRGFTLVELIIVVSIFSVLLGILVPSLNSILGFREQRASSSIQAALDKTKTEAMDRLVGEMVLSKSSDGYYITYYLDHGKTSTESKDSSEKIAPASVNIKYTTCNADGTVSAEQTLSEAEGSRSCLIITYNRETGGFRPLQTAVMTQAEINNYLNGGTDSSVSAAGQGKNLTFKDDSCYLKSIIIDGSSGKRVITLDPAAGTYTVTVE